MPSSIQAQETLTPHQFVGLEVIMLFNVHVYEG